MKHMALLIALLFGWASLSSATEILRWQRLPLPVHLVVGQERVILMDRNVRVGVPASLSGRLRVQSAGGAIYLRANSHIEPTRLQLQDVENGALILLDIVAVPATTDQLPLDPVRIIDDEQLTGRSGQHDGSAGVQVERTQETPRPIHTTPVAVTLTRYAAQSLYAPLRTVEPVNGITPVPVSRNLTFDALLPMLPVRARALISWRLNDHWLTAVKLTNTTDRWLTLDPSALQGDFAAATFQHRDLGPAGDSSDTTVLYLITRGHEIAESLLPAISPFDASVNLPAPDRNEGKQP